LILATLHFISQAPQAGQPVVITSWMELLTVLQLGALIGLLGGAYHHVECHETGCHKMGRFTHDHLKFCHIHHPGVPNDGVIHIGSDNDPVSRKADA